MGESNHGLLRDVLLIYKFVYFTFPFFSQTFYGNIDQTSLVRNSVTISDAISFVRFYPRRWTSGFEVPCMRVEIYGIYNPSK